jgi:hypothetical protein
MMIRFRKTISSGNIARPVVPKTKCQVQSNQARVPGHAGVAFVLNRNLEEVRQKNLQNKREITRKLPPAKKVRLITCHKLLFISFFFFK